MPVVNDPESLTAWHAQPVSQVKADEQLVTIRQQRKLARAEYQPLLLAETQARFWAGSNIRGDVDNLLASANSDAERAYLHLLYGQLLMSCKLTGAMDELDLGFKLAAAEFADADYLVVMRRHNTLRHLVLTKLRTKPATLDELLKEAAVINQFKGEIRRQYSVTVSRDDIVG